MKSPFVTMKVILAAFVGAFIGLSTSTSAHALTFDWQFTTSAGTAGAGQVIMGTISGLVEGTNNGVGLTIAVTQAPDSQLLTNTWTLLSAPTGDAFTVTGGVVTFAYAVYSNPSPLPSGADLWFGSNGGVTYFPELQTGNRSDDYYNNTTGAAMSFSAASATPLPAALPLFATGLGALGLLGWRRKRKSAPALTA